MTLAGVNEVTKGQVIAADVLNANDVILVTKGSLVDDKVLRRLKMWGVKEVEISDGQLEQQDDVAGAGSRQLEFTVNRVMDRILLISELIKSERIFNFDK